MAVKNLAKFSKNSGTFLNMIQVSLYALHSFTNTYRGVPEIFSAHIPWMALEANGGVGSVNPQIAHGFAMAVEC